MTDYRWPRVALGELLAPIARMEDVLPGRSYRLVGVRWWGEGAYERAPVDGGETRYKNLSRIEADDIIINKIWARHGSVAVVTAETAGCHASGEFPTFTANKTCMLPGWFHWFTKTRDCWEQCDAKSRGTSGQNRIRPERFLEVEVPLPPVEEQRQIVARLDAIAAKVEEAQRLRAETERQIRALTTSLFLDCDVGIPMGDFLTLKLPDVHVDASETYSFAGVYSFGRGVFRSGERSGMETSYRRLTTLREGNFVYPKLMAWEGAFGVVPSECDGAVVSTEFTVFEVNRELVLPEVIDAYVRRPAVWEQLAGASTGTNVRRRRLQPRDLLAKSMPVPPMDKQVEIAKVHRLTETIELAATDVSLGLQALATSVVNSVFRNSP